MFPRPVVRLFLVALAGLAGSPAVRAQEKPGRAYVTIPFQGNLEDMLRRQFNQARLDEMIRNLNIDLAKIKIDPKSLPPLEKIDLGQEKNVKEWLDKLPAEKKEPIQQRLKEIETALKKMPATPKVSEKPFPLPGARPAAPPEETLENRFGRWARDLMKDAENSNLADLIKGSKAWQEGLKDFERFLSERDMAGDWFGLGKLNLPTPRNLNIDLGQGWSKIKNLSLPGLPSVKLPMPDLRIGNPLPKLGLLGLPSGSPAVGTAAVWVLVILGLILVAWQLVRRVGRPGQAGPGWRLGPWPVDPARISTRAELIAAFDYLALLCLGRQARTWNHRAIGAGLGASNPERQRAASELASLYEWARYAPEPVSPDDQALARARRDLCFLAEAAAS